MRGHWEDLDVGTRGSDEKSGLDLDGSLLRIKLSQSCLESLNFASLIIDRISQLQISSIQEGINS